MAEWDNTIPLSAGLFHLKGKNTVPWWALQLNSGLTAAVTWHLKCCMLKVKAKVNHFTAHSKIQKISMY